MGQDPQKRVIRGAINGETYTEGGGFGTLVRLTFHILMETNSSSVATIPSFKTLSRIVFNLSPVENVDLGVQVRRAAVYYFVPRNPLP